MSKTSKKIPAQPKKPFFDYNSLETPNKILLNSVMSKYPVNVEKAQSITSSSQPKPRKISLAEYTKSLDADSYYSVPKIIQDDQINRGVWN